MDSTRKIAVVVGILFLTVMVTNLGGGGLLETLFAEADYLTNISKNTVEIWIGMSLETISGIAVIAISFLMFPILKKQNESMALGYVCFRLMESVFIFVGAIIPVLLISLSQEAAEAAFSQAIGAMLITARSQMIGLLIPVFFSLGAFIFYYLLYQSKLVPRFISVWGFVGVSLIVVLNLLEADIVTGLTLALPIILNEIFLGIWLITKGFSKDS